MEVSSEITFEKVMLMSAHKNLVVATCLIVCTTTSIQGSPPANGAETSASVTERHLDETQTGFKVAETTNFRILHKQTRATADKYAQAAERARIWSQKKWFESQEDWQTRSRYTCMAGPWGISSVAGEKMP